MRALLPIVFLACGVGEAHAQERFVERTPLPRHPIVRTMEQTGNPNQVAAHAQPSIGPHDAGGYIGGGKLFGQGFFHRGGTSFGPILEGTYGTDFGGFTGHTNRVFLGASPDPSHGPAQAQGYRTDGHYYPPDVFALRPLRKAILEKRHEAEERKHGQHK